MSMKLGLEWRRDFSVSVPEQVQLFKKHGFDATFVTLTEPDLDESIPCLKKHGISCESGHTPFDGINEMWLKGEKGDYMLERLKKSVDVCAKHQIPVAVVHLSSGMTPPRMSDVGFERYDRLMDYADQNNVKIAYENIRRLDNVAYAMANYPQAVFCWDVGHESCYTKGMEFMPLFGERIGALHLHDNSGIYDEDLHRLPYDGVIDMDRAAKYLANSPFQGPIMLEVTPASAGIEDLDLFYEKAYRAAERFASRVEAFRSEILN